MTKFEEDLNRRMDLKEVPMYFTQSGCSMTRKTYIETNWVFDTYKNWHPDEEFQDKEKEIKRLRKINHLYKKAKGNAERMAVDRGERLNQAQDEIAYLESQLQQQALPVVPECVAELFNEYRLENIQRLFEFGIDDIKSNKMIKALMWRDKHPDTFSLAFITGNYQVEKPQLFYIALPKVYGLSDSTFVSKAESGIISEFTKGKDYALKLTEQEIKSIDERYWQFAVPVEDGE